jgi:serine phosphatase RsbU (regulator of sigma subunit)
MQKKEFKILIIESNVTVSKRLAKKLKEKGFPSDRVTDREAALGRVQIENYEVIFMDMELEGEDCFLLLDEIKSMYYYQNVPIILLAREEKIQDVVKYINAGADDYVNKEAPGAVLFTRLEASLAKKRLQDQHKSIVHQLEQELYMAQKIQRNLVPSATPQLPGVDFCSSYFPMSQVGGDFFDFIEMREKDKIGIFISDVSGHGVPAALITSMVKILIEKSAEHKNSPLKLLNYLNQSLLEHLNDNFITAFYCVLDLENKKLKFARGGHPYPVLLRDGQVIELVSEGPILAAFHDIICEEKEIQLLSGDKIILFTDGLTQSENEENEIFEPMCMNLLKNNSFLPIKALVEKINKELFRHMNYNFASDDICILGMEIK